MSLPPADWWLTVAYDPRTLTAEQRQGLACVVCGNPWRRAVPVGHVHAPDGFQVFACVGACARTAQRREGGGRA